MPSLTIEVLLTRFPGIIMGVAYGVAGWKKSGESWDPWKFLKSVAYLAIAGFITGDQPLEQILGVLAVANAKKFTWTVVDLLSGGKTK